MASQLLYLKGFNVVTCNAQITAIESTEYDREDIRLDKTCFYPRGGGQDWDMGTIETVEDSVVFTVDEVRLDENGVVHHIGKYYSVGELKVGDTVKCTVDADRREINTRLHSAGHVIDMAIDALGLDWVGTKGQHYPHLSAVEYSGTWEPEKADVLRDAIEQKANELIQSDIENSIRLMPVEEMHTVCRYVPESIPKNKPARVVMYGQDFGIPCGGTHVKNLKEIGTVTVPKLKQKQGVIRVNYTVEGIN